MNTQLPPILEAKLADFRRRVWVVKLAEGLLAALFGIVLSYLLVFILDRFLETPGWLRLTLLTAGALTLGLGLPLKWHQWVWRQRRLEDAARLLRRSFPRLGDQLLGLVELARMDHPAGRSDRLVEAAMEQAAESVRDRDFRNAVPDARHRHWGWAAAGVITLALAAFMLVNEAARNAFARWITPWRDVERFTFARVESLPTTLVVPYAEPFELPVRLASDTRMSPRDATARIGKQPSVTATLSTDTYPFAFPPQKEAQSLALYLGDIRETIAIHPRPRPELSNLAIRVQLPAYLQYRSEQRYEVRGGTASVVKGAQAVFEATSTNSLLSAELDGKTQQIRDSLIATEAFPVEEDSERKLTWKDRDGLTPRDPLVLKVLAAADEAPRIAARRESLEQVVLDSEVVNFDLSASDDFGIRRMGLEWIGTGAEKGQGEKIAFGGNPEQKEVSAPATFCATREGIAPGTYEVRAWADDYFPDRKRSVSAAFVLHVLDKTEHALWVTAQIGKWLDAARESYEREQQLHQTNQELRELSAAELERPENRRRVAQQASAENANAARLEHLTQLGKSLVEQATKNDEFDATRLESLATLLKSLKDIAGNRMPSVSSLLKQTASAPAQNSSQNNSSPSKPAQSETTPPAAGLPSLTSREEGSAKTQEPANSPSPKPPGAPKFGLPGTTLGAAKPKDSDPGKPPESPAQATLDQAIREQKDLLAEFAKVSDQLNEILASLEASTFVKRFKAASKKQSGIASEISQKTLDSFGIERGTPAAAAPISMRAEDQSEIVRVIQSDLEAYFQRKQDSRFKIIVDEMKEVQIVKSLARGGERISDNLTGQAMIGSEYWADVMDRWAEELVSASNCKSCSSCSGDSLPPEIVLKVMQALRDEMKLRDETREAENAKPAWEPTKFAETANGLGLKQLAIRKHTDSAIEDIRALPEGEARFSKELNLLHAVVGVMDEAAGLLVSPDTGPKAVAAETEAIELLLQAKRINPNGGGGGGSNPGGGGKGTTSSAALTDIGPGADPETIVEARPVGQATGRAGKEFPDEFKSGLDTYFNLLEGGNPE